MAFNGMHLERTYREVIISDTAASSPRRTARSAACTTAATTTSPRSRVRAVRLAGRVCLPAPRACPLPEPQQTAARALGAERSWGSLRLHRWDQRAHGQTAPLRNVARTPPCAPSRDQHRARCRGGRARPCRMLVLLTCGGTPQRGHDRAEAGAPLAEHDDHLRAEHDDPLGTGHDDHRAARVDRRQPAPRGDRGRLSQLTQV
jgi:hypothetical protein